MDLCVIYIIIVASVNSVGSRYDHFVLIPVGHSVGSYFDTGTITTRIYDGSDVVVASQKRPQKKGVAAATTTARSGERITAVLVVFFHIRYIYLIDYFSYVILLIHSMVSVKSAYEK